MKNYTRSELGALMRLESEKAVMMTAFLFLTVASLWSHLALGPVILQPALYLALLLIHGAGFVSLKMKNLERFLIVVSTLAVVFYFRNCFVDLRVPFLPIAPVFFIVSAVTLTGYGQGKYLQAAMRWVFGWSCALYFTSFHGAEPQALNARSPLLFGMLISFLFFVSFFLAVEILGRRFEGAAAALGARNDYGDKRIHASKLQTLGELAASIAHEINTPLTSIKGYNYQFKTELSEAENPDKALLLNFSDRIAFNLDRVAQITKVLRSFSRDSNLEEIGVVSLREVFDDTLTLLKHHLKASGIDLVSDVPQDEVFVKGSLVQLSQLLVNLLTNARDAVKESKQKRIVMGYSANSNFVQMWVEDTGPGIPEKIREEIFRPFYTTKVAGSGTGLGLYISQLIAEKHSTQLKFECPVNLSTGEMLGTRFYVELQRVSAPAQAPRKAA